MCEGMLHIRDVEGPKKTGSVETRLEAMEQQVFKCQGMVERGLNANHMMITEFTNKHRIDANDIGKHLSRLYDRIDQLQAQIYDVQNQNYDSPATATAAARSSPDPAAADLLVRPPPRVTTTGNGVPTAGSGGSRRFRPLHVRPFANLTAAAVVNSRRRLPLRVREENDL
ncbi:40S ribosomal protein S5-1 [Hordeum vulgare]|nr:40S ribosomal protein S5-1 [Hordeum vulgare]